MRWALLGLALLLAVVGLFYVGGVAFVSSLSGATEGRAVDGPRTVVATTGQVEAATWPDRRPEASASGMPRPEPSSAPQPMVASDPEDSSPIASEQRVFKTRKALETIDPREFLREPTVPK